jgi:hypothetical protein
VISDKEARIRRLERLAASLRDRTYTKELRIGWLEQQIRILAGLSSWGGDEGQHTPDDIPCAEKLCVFVGGCCGKGLPDVTVVVKTSPGGTTVLSGSTGEVGSIIGVGWICWDLPGDGNYTVTISDLPSGFVAVAPTTSLTKPVSVGGCRKRTLIFTTGPDWDGVTGRNPCACCADNVDGNLPPPLAETLNLTDGEGRGIALARGTTPSTGALWCKCEEIDILAPYATIPKRCDDLTPKTSAWVQYCIGCPTHLGPQDLQVSWYYCPRQCELYIPNHDGCNAPNGLLTSVSIHGTVSSIDPFVWEADDVDLIGDCPNPPGTGGNCGCYYGIGPYWFSYFGKLFYPNRNGTWTILG